MSSLADWPVCAECTRRKREDDPEYRGTVPVEEYGVDVDEGNAVLFSGSYSVRVTVVAACSHGRGFRSDTVRHQASEPIDCPHWWNVDRAKPLKSHYLRHAIRTLAFFKPGETKPAHRMVTLVH